MYQEKEAEFEESNLLITDDVEYLNSDQIEKEFDNELLNYALHYAKTGYPIFPLQNVRKLNGVVVCSCKHWESCGKQGKHPRTENGYKDATTDENKIIDWWEKHPDANIGLLTGRESGIFVLDIDPRNFGEHSFEYLQDYYKNLLGIDFQSIPETLTTISGSGGRHLYFKHIMDLPIKASPSMIGAGLDVKADGGYVVAPPSNHMSGDNYCWEHINTSIKNAPEWLIYVILQAIKERKTISLGKSKGKKSKLVKGRKIEEGARHDFFFRYICSLVNSNSENQVLEKAIKINDEMLNPPFSDREVQYQVRYLYKKYGK